MKRMVVFLAVAALAGCAGAGISDLDRPMFGSDPVELGAAGPDGMIPAMLPAAGAGQGIGVAAFLLMPRADDDQEAWESDLGIEAYYAMGLRDTIGLRLGIGVMTYEADNGDGEISSIPVTATLTFDMMDKGPGKIYALAGIGFYINDDDDLDIDVDSSIGTQIGAGFKFSSAGGRLSVYGEGRLLLMDADADLGASDEVLLDAMIIAGGVRFNF